MFFALIDWLLFAVRFGVVWCDLGWLAVSKADLEGAIKVVFMIVGKMAEDRGLSKYQVRSKADAQSSLALD